MAQLTGEARYTDLFEWQLYNAAAVGMGLDGTTYLYNNPLSCRGGVTRKAWYAVPCCPSNLSRTWADLGKYIYSQTQDGIWIYQYVSSQWEADLAHVDVRSSFPWDGNIEIKITPSAQTKEFTIRLRSPSWSSKLQIKVNGQEVETPFNLLNNDKTASGFDPRTAIFHPLHREWSVGDVILVESEMPIITRHAHPKVKGHRGKVAITRGPLVYCLESLDNPSIDIFNVRVNANSLQPILTKTELGEIVQLNGMSFDGQPLILIPYFLWGNRGKSQMTVWVNE